MKSIINKSIETNHGMRIIFFAAAVIGVISEMALATNPDGFAEVDNDAIADLDLDTGLDLDADLDADAYADPDCKCERTVNIVTSKDSQGNSCCPTEPDAEE